MKKPSVHALLFMSLVLGAALGVACHGVESERLAWISTHVLAPIGQVFLRLIFMVVVPMVFSALVLGVYELGQGRGLGKIVGKTLGFTVLASAMSVLIGVTLVNLFKPGEGVALGQSSEQLSAQVGAIQKNALAAKPLSQTLVDLIPRNPLDSAVRALDGEMISLMVFALVFGLALSFVAQTRASKGSGTGLLVGLLQELFDASLKVIEWAMRLAPIAVFSMVFNTGYKLGAGIFASLGLYVMIVVGGLLIHQFLVYPMFLKAFTRRSPWEFFKSCRPVYLHAFATASSNATLPLSLQTAEESLKIPGRISRFVLTIGSTANQNGTALFEGVTVLFLAQVYGVHLGLTEQVLVVVMSILAGIGTAGVPGGSLPLIMILLQQVGVPPEGLGIVLGVDRFLDMCRTTVNVSGDLVIAAMVAEEPAQSAV